MNKVVIKKVFIRTFGCQMNVRDSEVICGLLSTNGYRLTTNLDEADIVIFNTCSVRGHAEDKVWSEVGRYAKKGQSPSPRHRRGVPIIGLVGCMAQNYKEQIFERSPSVDFVVGPSDIHRIPEIIRKFQIPDSKFQTNPKSQIPNTKQKNLFEFKIWETNGKLRPEEIYHTGFYEDKNHAYVVISEGCSNYCSYCVVPHVRGELHNRNYKDILKEIEEAVDKGITKITLLGQNVNAYMLNLKSQIPNHKQILNSNFQFQNLNLEKEINFIDLLKMVNEIKGLKEFSFITSHPKDTSLELFKAMADLEKLKKYLHLPIQSGSDKILKLMNRGYTRKYYLDLVDNYRRIVLGGALSTDIILGFPGENEEDFQNTYNLVKDVEFDAAFIFKYSPRPHTEAVKMADSVAREEKERRHALILELQKRISRKRRA